MSYCGYWLLQLISGNHLDYRIFFLLPCFCLYISIQKRYLKATLQFVNWVNGVSTHLSFQKGIEAQKNVPLPGNMDVESHVTEGQWDWSCSEFLFSRLLYLSARLWNQPSPPSPFVRVLAIVIYQQNSFTTVNYQLNLADRAVLSLFNLFMLL